MRMTTSCALISSPLLALSRPRALPTSAHRSYRTGGRPLSGKKPRSSSGNSGTSSGGPAGPECDRKKVLLSANTRPRASLSSSSTTGTPMTSAGAALCSAFSQMSRAAASLFSCCSALTSAGSSSSPSMSGLLLFFRSSWITFTSTEENCGMVPELTRACSISAAARLARSRVSLSRFSKKVARRSAASRAWTSSAYLALMRATFSSRCCKRTAHGNFEDELD
mmetsp:Transcript_17965/g.39227  ORF Transcript_17965/g.39227 Transcript_17965/m.39227 type:complete len:223 (+) Transcript_17965:763-1431(+)